MASGAGTGTESDRERAYWVAFHHVAHVGPASIRRLQDHFGSLERAWTADGRKLRAALTERAVTALESTRRELDVSILMASLDKQGIAVVTPGDAVYPALLREVPSPPPVLFYRGDLIPEDDTAVAIVGTRQVTAYGRTMAEQLGAGLAQAGITVVSGLARGVDGIAHKAALDAGGRTIAVLGSGVNWIYPYEHRHLSERIMRSGAVLSEYAPDRKPDAPNFPARNRIISGLSLAVIVVEAPERSGALITVDFAADQGREVFAVPGPVGAQKSAGCNKLLRDGARLVRSAEDVLEDLQLDRKLAEVAVQQALPLGADEHRVLAVLSAEPRHIDEICELASLSIAVASSCLITMELQGLIRNAGAQHYVRVGR